MSHHYVEVEDTTILASTDGAVLFDIDGDEIWIPRSQIEDNGDDFDDGDQITIYVAQWFAEKEGISMKESEKIDAVIDAASVAELAMYESEVYYMDHKMIVLPHVRFARFKLWESLDAIGKVMARR